MKVQPYTIEEAEKVLKCLGNCHYWLCELVKQKKINEAQAGLIITRGGIKWESSRIKRKKFFM